MSRPHKSPKPRTRLQLLNSQLAVVQKQVRDFYSTIAFMNAWENTAAKHQGNAMRRRANYVAVVLDAERRGFRTFSPTS